MHYSIALKAYQHLLHVHSAQFSDTKVWSKLPYRRCRTIREGRVTRCTQRPLLASVGQSHIRAGVTFRPIFPVQLGSGRYSENIFQKHFKASALRMANWTQYQFHHFACQSAHVKQFIERDKYKEIAENYIARASWISWMRKMERQK